MIDGKVIGPGLVSAPCLLDMEKGDAEHMAKLAVRCQCDKCTHAKILNVSVTSIDSLQCKECGEISATLVNDVCNTCLSKKDDDDVIDWPKHYNAGKIQPIDVIEDWQLDFRLANAVKYIARHSHKENAKKDLEKAIWYIQRFIDKELTKEEKNG